ncbi:hypothetical protein BUALT_Bualt01G0025700 [Buddleja alternifolia]|uniref:Transposase n=1 Tax=Buddleja alternifolia TaxID=168488 RepID=A0AAV6YEG9_9LAMI|nr:hypothetical protein BUALT_Bualt01G0025700 [Buddleja alternifolia]
MHDLVSFNDETCIDNLRMSRNGFGRLCCLGALDDTYIPLRVAQKDKPRYRNRKGDVSVNVLSVCNINMNYVYMLCGWEVSSADSRALRDAITRENDFRVPDENYYLCDSGYTNGDGFLAPYCGVRNHIQEWSSHRTPSQNAYELFNKIHARACNVIERSFALLKAPHRGVRNHIQEWNSHRTPPQNAYELFNKIHARARNVMEWSFALLKVDPLEAEFPEVDDEISNDHNSTFIDQVEPSQHWTLAGKTPTAASSGQIRGGAANLGNDNGFKSGYQMLLEQAMVQAFSGTNIRAGPHINSRTTVWRKNYATISTLQSRSGFGWNDATNMITVESEDAWNNFVKIFGKDRATGERAEGFADVVEEQVHSPHVNLAGKENEFGGDYVPVYSNPQADECQSMSFSNANHGSSSKSLDKRKRKVVDENDDRFIDLMTSFCDKTNERLGDISRRIGFKHDVSLPRKVVYEALGDLGSSLDMEEMVLVSHLIVNNTKNMDQFFSLPNNGRKTMVHMILEGKFPGMGGD